MILHLSWTLTTETPEGVTVTSELTERDFTPTQLAALAHIIRYRGETPRSQTASDQTPARQPSPTDRVAQSGAARAQGYTGECCQDPLCGGFRVKRNGACTVCDDCGRTTGCS